MVGKINNTNTPKFFKFASQVTACTLYRRAFPPAKAVAVLFPQKWPEIDSMGEERLQLLAKLNGLINFSPKFLSVKDVTDLLGFDNEQNSSEAKMRFRNLLQTHGENINNMLSIFIPESEQTYTNRKKIQTISSALFTIYEAERPSLALIRRIFKDEEISRETTMHELWEKLPKAQVARLKDSLMTLTRSLLAGNEFNIQNLSEIGDEVISNLSSKLNFPFSYSALLRIIISPPSLTVGQLIDATNNKKTETFADIAEAVINADSVRKTVKSGISEEMSLALLDFEDPTFSVFYLIHWLKNPNFSKSLNKYRPDMGIRSLFGVLLRTLTQKALMQLDK